MTRAEFYHQLHMASPGAPPLLSAPEREVLLRRAAREAAAAGTSPPFRLRPGLIVQMLDFYDELRRREQSLGDFERLAVGRLAPSADMDRGAERLLRQTEFLVAAFAGFEQLTRATGCIDEHGLRALLLEPDILPQRAYAHVVVTVADQAADPRGLYASDFGLLTRLAGVTRLDVVATENLLASGFHERLHDLLPGIEEERFGQTASLPVLVAPETAEPDQRWFICRDREEELTQIVRWLKHRARSPHESIRPPALDRFGIVFQRPLPYLYLARQVLTDGLVPYQALDALPLSAEPFAATIDVVFSFLASEGNRASIVELLHSPHLAFSSSLTRQRGGAARYEAARSEVLRRMGPARGASGDRRLGGKAARTPSVAPAVQHVVDAATALRAVLAADSASGQIEALLAFVRRFERLPGREPSLAVPAESPRSQESRNRRKPGPAATCAPVRRSWPPSNRCATRMRDTTTSRSTSSSCPARAALDRRADVLRRAPATTAIRLLDAASAPYADVDEIRIVGLVERDWPEPAQRSIFYPASMLSNMGWPADASRMAAARARVPGPVDLGA